MKRSTKVIIATLSALTATGAVFGALGGCTGLYDAMYSQLMYGPAPNLAERAQPFETTEETEVDGGQNE